MNAKVVGSDKHRDDSSSKNWLACNERDGDILEQGVEEEKGPQLNQNSNKDTIASPSIAKVKPKKRSFKEAFGEFKIEIGLNTRKVHGKPSHNMLVDVTLLGLKK